MSRNLAGEIEMAGCPAADVVGGWRAGADQGGPSEVAVVERLMMQCRMTCVRKKIRRVEKELWESVSVYREARHFVYVVRGGPCERQGGARGSISAPCARIGATGHPVDIEPPNVAEHEEGNEQCPHHRVAVVVRSVQVRLQGVAAWPNLETRSYLEATSPQCFSVRRTSQCHQSHQLW